MPCHREEKRDLKDAAALLRLIVLVCLACSPTRATWGEAAGQSTHCDRYGRPAGMEPKGELQG
jgi:hypothetical protein